MAGARSNAEEVARAIQHVLAGFDFTAPGISKAIGEEAFDIVAEKITDRTIAEQKGLDGRNLPELDPKYLASKLRKGFPELIGVRTGAMMALEQLKGTREIQPFAATMSYGKDNDLIERAGFFSQKRPFYGPDEDIARDVEDYLYQVLELYLSRGG